MNKQKIVSSNEHIAPVITLKKRQKAEGVQRLISIGVMKEVVENFKNGQIMFSERQNSIFNAVLYNVEAGSELQKIINEFEEAHKAIVYHVQLLHTHFGEMYSLLYVSRYEEEWEPDQQNLKEKYAYAYVVNGDVKEFGMIGIQMSMGGILRTS